MKLEKRKKREEIKKSDIVKKDQNQEERKI